MPRAVYCKQRRSSASIFQSGAPLVESSAVGVVYNIQHPGIELCKQGNPPNCNRGRWSASDAMTGQNAAPSYSHLTLRCRDAQSCTQVAFVWVLDAPTPGRSEVLGFSRSSNL